MKYIITILIFFIGCSNTHIEQSKKEKLTFVLVGASWCGPCQQMKSDIKKYNLLKDYNFYYIDSDENKEILTKLNITNIPAYFLVDNNNKILKRKTGYTNKNDVISFLVSIK